MGYDYTSYMLGGAPRTKETMPDFCENMDPDKWDTTVWYWVTRNPQEFYGLTVCQQDPGFGVSQFGIRAQVNDYLGARVGVSTSVFGYWLVIVEYQELGVQNT